MDSLRTNLTSPDAGQRCRAEELPALLCIGAIGPDALRQSPFNLGQTSLGSFPMVQQSNPSFPPPPGPVPTVEVAIAILHQNNQFLLQLRDDNPAIIYPGYWAFCGGHLDPGEDANCAIRRELQEEIAHVPEGLLLFEQATTVGPDKTVIRNFYHAALTVPLSSLEVNEGQELGLASLEDIRRGQCFSQVLQETRPIGPPHQAMLLKFIAAYPVT